MEGVSGEGVTALDKSELEQAYRSLEQQYKDLVGRNPAGVYRTTLDGRFLECNDAMARILGFEDREQLLTQQASSLYASNAERERFLQALGKEKKLLNFELTLRHKNGRPAAEWSGNDPGNLDRHHRETSSGT